MEWLTNLKIGPRLLVGFIIVIVLGIVASFVSITSMSSVATISKSLDAAKEIKSDVGTLGNQRRDFLLTGSI